MRSERNKNLNIELTEQEHERLTEIKETHGLTWRGLLFQAAKHLDDEPI